LLNAQWSRPSFRGTGSLCFQRARVASLASEARHRSVASSSLRAGAVSTWSVWLPHHQAYRASGSLAIMRHSRATHVMTGHCRSAHSAAEWSIALGRAAAEEESPLRA